jgi:hypothetical protein
MAVAIDYMTQYISGSSVTLKLLKEAILKEMPEYRPTHALTQLKAKGLVEINSDYIVDFSKLLESFEAFKVLQSQEMAKEKAEAKVVVAVYTSEQANTLLTFVTRRQMECNHPEVSFKLRRHPRYMVGDIEVPIDLAKTLMCVLGYKLEVSTDG